MTHRSAARRAFSMISPNSALLWRGGQHRAYRPHQHPRRMHCPDELVAATLKVNRQRGAQRGDPAGQVIAADHIQDGHRRQCRRWRALRW